MKKISFIFLSAFLFSCSGNVQTPAETDNTQLKANLEKTLSEYKMAISELCSCTGACDNLKARAEACRVTLEKTHADFDLTYEFGSDTGNAYYNTIDSANAAFEKCK